MTTTEEFEQLYNELAALKAENERLKELYTTYVLQCEKLAADKAELVEALMDLNSLVTYDHPAPNAVYKAERLLSKHEAK